MNIILEYIVVVEYQNITVFIYSSIILIIIIHIQLQYLHVCSRSLSLSTRTICCPAHRAKRACSACECLCERCIVACGGQHAWAPHITLQNEQAESNNAHAGERLLSYA